MEPCRCLWWGNDGTQKIRTRHHPNCQFYDPEQDARDVVDALLIAIEKSGALKNKNEELLNAYNMARVFLFKFDPVEALSKAKTIYDLAFNIDGQNKVNNTLKITECEPIENNNSEKIIVIL